VKRVLLLATTTGYQTRAFGEAAERLGVELVFATDRCHVIDDPWQDAAIPIRFHEPKKSTAAIAAAAAARPIDGILVVGDRPTIVAARAAAALGLPGHPADAVAIARDKRRTRQRLKAAGLLVPWFASVPITSEPDDLTVPFPCVVKPLALSASRGVIRANDRDEFRAAFERLRRLLLSPEVRVERSALHDQALVESFIEGREYALEGVLHEGVLHPFALFDKPDPLDGPFFEETIYVTPSRAPAVEQRAIERAIGAAAAAIGLYHGPIHAECRVAPDAGADGAPRVFVLEVAARPIGGLCARALRLENPVPIPYEEFLLRHALGESPAGWRREAAASGVMMIPIPARGIYRDVAGVDAARAIPGIDDVRITAKPDQVLVPLPEGASYLGFIFARGAEPALVEDALRRAHRALSFAIDPELRVVQSAHG
jgi:biotin carboxylase